MKYYLSSYKFGDDPGRLKGLIPENPRLGHINNARDFSGADPERAAIYQSEEIEFLNELGFEAEALDLRTYFEGRNHLLREKVAGIGALWVSGGCSFVLLQAMHLSGFVEIFPSLDRRSDFLYGGYSAGICVLCDDLQVLHRRDNPFDMPYQNFDPPITTGLGKFDFIWLPHYDSNHNESAIVEEEIEQCKREGLRFRTIRDGEVFII